MSTFKQVTITLLVVVAVWLGYLKLRGEPVVNPITQPVYPTPAPAQVIQVQQIVQYPTPAVQVIELPPPALPTVYIEPTIDFNRGGFEAPTLSGQTGNHNPGRTDKRSTAAP